MTQANQGGFKGKKLDMLNDQSSCNDILVTTADGKSTVCVTVCSTIDMFQQQGKCVYQCESRIYDSNNNCVDSCSGNSKYLVYQESTNMYECKAEANSATPQYSFNITIGQVTYKSDTCKGLPGIYYLIEGNEPKCSQECNGLIKLDGNEQTCVQQCEENEIQYEQDSGNYCLTECKLLDLVYQNQQCMKQCLNGIPVDSKCQTDCKSVLIDDQHNEVCNTVECNQSAYKYVIQEKDHQICATQCSIDNGLYMDGENCVKECPSGKYVSINQTTNTGYCVDSCLKINGQYILYDEGKCSYSCNLTTNYIINEYNENLCISRSSLSEEIEFNPLSIVLGSFCGVIALLMIIIVSVGQKTRNKQARLLQ